MPSTSNAPEPGSRDCPSCGTAVAVDANFCAHCGAELTESSRPAYCSNCGDPFDPDDEFCASCGTARADSSETTYSSSDGTHSRSHRSPTSADRNRPDSSPTHTDHSRSPTSHTNRSSEGDGADSRQSDTGDSRRNDAVGSTRVDTDSDATRTFRRQVQRHLEAGWEIEHDYGDRVVLVDRDIGSIGIHVLLVLLTGGLGNLLYGWYHYSECAQTRHLSVDDPQPDIDTDPTPDSPPEGTTSSEPDTLTTISSYVMSGFLVAIGLSLLTLALTNGIVVLLAAGLVLTTGGLYVAPTVRERLGRRHSLTSFGRVRTVDHRVVEPTERCDESCIVCGERVDSGLVRRRRDETVVAGVPIRTHAMEYNHYCEACARDELAGPGVDPESIDDDPRFDDQSIDEILEREPSESSSAEPSDFSPSASAESSSAESSESSSTESSESSSTKSSDVLTETDE